MWQRCAWQPTWAQEARQTPGVACVLGMSPNGMSNAVIRFVPQVACALMQSCCTCIPYRITVLPLHVQGGGEGTASLDQRIQSLLGSSPVMLLMKGSPERPRCGFSSRVVDALQKADVQFKHFDILQVCRFHVCRLLDSGKPCERQCNLSVLCM